MDAEQKDLRLKFTAFDLEESVNCTADYVVVRDGKEKTSPLIGNYNKNIFSSLLMLLFPNDSTVFPLQGSIVGIHYQSWWRPRPSPCISCFTRMSSTLSKVSKRSGVPLLPRRVLHSWVRLLPYMSSFGFC